MTTITQLRKTALSLPESTEHDRAFRVRDKRFASVDEHGRVHLNLPPAEAEAFLAAHPTAERLPRGGVLVPLGDIDGQALNHWVRRAWLSRAPKSLAARDSAAETAVPGEVGDLPKGIGRPATQALANAGLTTLAQVAALSDAELLAMHGVGPKAVRVLREAAQNV
ncbi:MULTISPECIES: MmcQ/YjbR family DNA-binding protein [Saccharothrix]|uniref:MmcQ/YjbR family DNA-binding protein n=1 Tax=Saccharothrix TaxID=2071 RepID=UPI000938CF70|nr:helix-hairpin-helix domain-containing protein [Saccharothrix sp. CB00851]OKI23198.1 hypothetical protein A6A25_35320 [Saccharothrix sp. CB00851]